MEAAGVNNTDIWTREGAYGASDDPSATSGWRREAFAFPRIQGADIVGTVVACGKEAPPTLLGRRIIVDPVLYETTNGGSPFSPSLFGSERDGGFAEFVAIPHENAIPIDSKHSSAQLAGFPCSYLTALHMIRRATGQPGESILVTGAGGGVGTGTVQLAKAFGLTVTAVSSGAREKRLRALGADYFIPRDSGRLSRRVHEHTATHGPFDVAADVLGGPALSVVLSALRKGGRLVTSGAIAGAVIELDLRTVYLNQLELIGSTLGTHEEFRELLRLIEEERLLPVVDRVFTLGEIRTAQKAFKEKRFTGKLSLLPAGARETEDRQMQQ